MIEKLQLGLLLVALFGGYLTYVGFRNDLRKIERYRR